MGHFDEGDIELSDVGKKKTHRVNNHDILNGINRILPDGGLPLIIRPLFNYRVIIYRRIA